MNATLAPNFSSSSQNTETAITWEDETLRICVTAILVVIIVLTLLGNGFVCWAFYCQSQLRNAPYYPLLSLALADMLCAICAMPAYIVKRNIAGGGKERISCSVFRFTYFLSVYASILSLTAVSLQRFVAIKMPLKHRTLLTEQKMIVGLLLSWLDAALVSILPFVWQRDDAEKQCAYEPSKEWIIMVNLLNVCLPFIVIFACNVYTTYIAIRAKRTGTVTNAVRREQHLMFPMTVVLGAFIVCWAPSSIYYFLVMVCPQCFQPPFKRVQPVFAAVIKLLTFVNSCLNPLIYCWLNKHLRGAIHMSLLKRSKARKRKYMQTNGIQKKVTTSVL